MTVDEALHEALEVCDDSAGFVVRTIVRTLAAEVRRLRQANEDDCWAFAEMLVRVKRRLAALEAQLGPENKP